MKNPLRLPYVAKKYPIAFSIALVLHIIFLIILIYYRDSATWQPLNVKPLPLKQVDNPLPKGVAIDFELIEQEKKRILEKKQKEQQAFKQRQQELARIEKQKKIALQKRKVEEKAAQLAEQKRKAEERKKQQAEQKRKAEELKKQQAIQKRKVEEKATRLAEKKRKVEEKAAKIAEQKRKAEERKKQQAVQKRKAEEKAIKIAEQKRIVTELAVKKIRQKMAASVQRFKQEKLHYELSRDLVKEESEQNKLLLEQQLQALKGDYIALIAADVRKNWRASQLFQKNWHCTVLVKQDIKGNVNAVNVINCNTNSKAFRRSVKSAVNKASPLPNAPIGDVFDEIIQFEFKPVQ